MTVRNAYCSWCMAKTDHKLQEQNYLRRNVYRCLSCNERTVECRYCSNMAKGDPKWDHETCAEHDHSIASFEKLEMRLERLEDYEAFLERESWNMAKAGTVGAVAVGTALVFIPISYAAAPSIAAALGAKGLLGAAATGTAIQTLSGAALTSASLAAIGGGYGMAGGLAFVTATGAALGARQGGVVSNAYAREVEGFGLKKRRSGRGPTVIFVNGFLTQDEESYSDWEPGLEQRYGANPWYQLTWESKTLLSVGTLLGEAGAKGAIEGVMVAAAKRASKSAAGGLGVASLVASLAGNPWHVAMVKAAQTGILLADILARTNNPDGFILVGHSLGARVIFYALQALATKSAPIVHEAVLLGGAVGTDLTPGQSDGWKHAAQAVSGRIHNFYSTRDDVLRYAYSAGTFFTSTPIGRAPIAVPEHVDDHDVSAEVPGHQQYLANLAKLFERLA